MNVMVPKEFENISRQADLHANDALSSTSEENDSSSDSDASVDTKRQNRLTENCVTRKDGKM